MVKLQFDERQYKLTIPKALVEAKGWTKGTELRLEVDAQGNLILKKKGAP